MAATRAGLLRYVPEPKVSSQILPYNLAMVLSVVAGTQLRARSAWLVLGGASAAALGATSRAVQRAYACLPPGYDDDVAGGEKDDDAGAAGPSDNRGDEAGVVGRVGARLLLHADVLVRLGEVIWVACIVALEAQVDIVEDVCVG